MSEDPRPGTTASVERRVERLDEKVDALENRVAAVEINLSHTREMLTLQFAAVKSGQDATLTKLDLLDKQLQQAFLEGARMMADPTMTPAGKRIVDDLKAVRDASEGRMNELSAHVDEALRLARLGDKKWGIAAGLVAAMAIVLQIIGIAVRFVPGS